MSGDPASMTGRDLPNSHSAMNRRICFRRLLTGGWTLLGGQSFLGRLVAGVNTVLVAVFSYLGLRFLWPRAEAHDGAWVSLAPVGELLPGSVDARWLTRFGIYLVRQWSDGGERIVALKAACTHLGCMTQWDDSLRQFVCPCHGSAFNADGHRLRGPARRALERCAVRIRDGVLQLNTRQTFREENGGWNHPHSFVSVSTPTVRGDL